MKRPERASSRRTARLKRQLNKPLVDEQNVEPIAVGVHHPICDRVRHVLVSHLLRVAPRSCGEFELLDAIDSLIQSRRPIDLWTPDILGVGTKPKGVTDHSERIVPDSYVLSIGSSALRGWPVREDYPR